MVQPNGQAEGKGKESISIGDVQELCRLQCEPVAGFVGFCPLDFDDYDVSRVQEGAVIANFYGGFERCEDGVMVNDFEGASEKTRAQGGQKGHGEMLQTDGLV